MCFADSAWLMIPGLLIIGLTTYHKAASNKKETEDGAELADNKDAVAQRGTGPG